MRVFALIVLMGMSTSAFAVADLKSPKKLTLKQLATKISHRSLILVTATIKNANLLAQVL